MANSNLHQRITELSQCIEHLQAQYHIGDPRVAEVLSDALKDLETSLKELSAAEGEICRQNEELIEAVEEREKHLAEIFDANEILRRQSEMLGRSPVLIMDMDDRIITWCRGVEKLYGWTAEEAIGKVSHDLFRTEFSEPLECIKANVLRNGRWSGELSRITRDGRRIFIISQWVLHKDSSGKPSAIIEVNNDITERKQAEEKLRKQAFVLDSVSDAVIGLDMNYKINYWNSPAEEMYGYCAEEVLGRTSLEILKPEYPGMTREEVRDRIVSTGQIKVESIHYAKDGHRIFVELHSQLLYDNEGKPSGLLGIVRDITERKMAEDELVKAKEAAEAAAKVKAAFMANMSHELRTPMNAVIGMTSLLLDEDLTSEQRDCLETIRNGGEAMMTLINDLLDFSRVEKDMVSLENQPFSLRACIEESLEQVSVQANKKRLNLIYTIKYGTADAFIGDPGRLRQVLVNLLSNAVKFTDEGEVSMSVSSNSLGEKKHQLYFAIKDTGIGIPQEKMDQLFKPFCQVETTISRKRDGVGLGLAICEGLIKHMGGEIWVESEINKGSTFYFTIKAEVSQDLPISEVPAKLFENLAEQHPLRILVAEDNPSNQKVLVKMLKRMGYRADAVTNGREVIEALERRPYDLIFIDVRMPEMDGLKATKEIRRLWPDNGPKIIAITAYTLADDKEKCLEAGTDGYIAKPVEVDELAMLLCNIAPPSQE